jgi:methionine-rich copper-binding protein CopC
MFKHFLIIFLILLPFAAFAHSPLATLSPKDGAVLEQAPAEVKMVFKSIVKLIKLEMQKLNFEECSSLLGCLFSSNKGENITLDKHFIMKKSKQYLIGLPSLDAGDYIIKWRALGEDGHVIKGEFRFKVLGI